MESPELSRTVAANDFDLNVERLNRKALSDAEAAPTVSGWLLAARFGFGAWDFEEFMTCFLQSG